MEYYMNASGVNGREIRVLEGGPYLVLASKGQESSFPAASVDLNRYNGDKFAHEDHNF
jgi:hypothetical protein